MPLICRAQRQLVAKGQTEVQVLEHELKKVKEQLLKYDNEEKERQHKMRYYQTQIDKYQHVGYISYLAVLDVKMLIQSTPFNVNTAKGLFTFSISVSVYALLAFHSQSVSASVSEIPIKTLYKMLMLVLEMGAVPICWRRC